METIIFQIEVVHDRLGHRTIYRSTNDRGLYFDHSDNGKIIIYQYPEACGEMFDILAVLNNSSIVQITRITKIEFETRSKPIT